ncbi:hypothetical protein DPMN_034106 [Dreissena polymorpha]|uniref:Uncharacterized protein n=1 Tax=Dreissena polymorpha TaxID=45954 RepID=A0A9D4RJS1_DREPO|nr:hypothetical protein DPMN_034106 [Dreissena polymorpha]
MQYCCKFRLKFYLKPTDSGKENYAVHETTRTCTLLMEDRMSITLKRAITFCINIQNMKISRSSIE